MKTIGYAAYDPKSPLAPYEFERRELRPNDVAMEILYRYGFAVRMAALIARGRAGQLHFHLNRAMDNGLTRERAAEAVAHLDMYDKPRYVGAAVAKLARFYGRPLSLPGFQVAAHSCPASVEKYSRAASGRARPIDEASVQPPCA
ncbi:carboxymuconolactone decarboxylase family protein [Azotobacter vinelandii]